jgi:pyruvate kinase
MGPAVASYATLLELIDAGMNVARLNFSHGTHEEHAEIIQNLKKARQQKSVSLSIMLDTKGPEIRVGKVQGDVVLLQAGQDLLLVKDEIMGDAKRIQVTPPEIIDSLKEGMTVLFDDGYIEAHVVKKVAEGVVIQIENGATLKTHKGVNIPHAHVELPAMTQKDVADIKFGCQHEVDLIAASFIRSADHVQEIKKLLTACGRPETLVISKIENSLGVEHFDAILEASDGIMVARGDLGVELPLKRVPVLQKMMIRKCYSAAKPVVTATQMLESMIHNPRPTRAEVSDVANAIYDSTSCVMLSGETAVGQYPVETVRMMRSVIEETESDFDYLAFLERAEKGEKWDIAFSVALAAVKTAYTAKAKAIIASTQSGFTARLISRFRPKMPILVHTSSLKTYQQLALNWGVIPVPPLPAKSLEDVFKIATSFAIDRNILQPGDLVVTTSGSPFGVSGTTNTMIVTHCS